MRERESECVRGAREGARSNRIMIVFLISSLSGKLFLSHTHTRTPACSLLRSLTPSLSRARARARALSYAHLRVLASVLSFSLVRFLSRACTYSPSLYLFSRTHMRFACLLHCLLTIPLSFPCSPYLLLCPPYVAPPPVPSPSSPPFSRLSALFRTHIRL